MDSRKQLSEEETSPKLDAIYKIRVSKNIPLIVSSDDDNETSHDSPNLTMTQKQDRLDNLARIYPYILSEDLKSTLVECDWNVGVAIRTIKSHMSSGNGGHAAAAAAANAPSILSDENSEPDYPMPASLSTENIVYDEPIETFIVMDDESLDQTATATQTNGCGKKKAPMKKTKTVQKSVKRKRLNSDSQDAEDDSGDELFERSEKKFRKVQVYDSDDDDDDDDDSSGGNELSEKRKNVLEFMQTASESELKLMQYCSKKKAEAIIECRPYRTWDELVRKLNENKNLTTDLINSAFEMLLARKNIAALMNKCTNLAIQMETAITAEQRIKTQPKTLNPTLKLASYQLTGLNWLSTMHHQGLNGILADEMGLGKTVQVISFFAHLKEITPITSTSLVIVPSSTLDNWRLEFERWCPSIRVFLYHGSIDERRDIRRKWMTGLIRNIDIILTTYTMVYNSPEERKLFRTVPMRYVVFDEAHMLKNMNTQRYENLIRIKAAHRILLTGTPLQNNLLELMSLLVFVMPKMFAGRINDLKSLFQKSSKTKDEEDIPAFERSQINQAKRIMRPFVLRRLKKEVLRDLPPKTDVNIYCTMTKKQRHHYNNLVYLFQANRKDTTKEFNGMAMMMDLRKLSNHPLLLRYYYDGKKVYKIAKKLALDSNYKQTNVQYIIEDLFCMSDFAINQLTLEFPSIAKYKLPTELIPQSGKFQHLDKLLLDLKTDGHRVLLFSQFVIMLDIVEEYLKIRNHCYLRIDGSTPVHMRQTLIDDYQNDENIFIFLLSTKAGGLGINLTAADTVILHDIDFNPYNDKQAEDRCHRLGQQRPVTVYRLISEKTIEENMFEMAKEKLKLEHEITRNETDASEARNIMSLLSIALGLDNTTESDHETDAVAVSPATDPDTVAETA